MIWKTYFLVVICGTVCYGTNHAAERHGPHSASSALPLSTVATPTSQAPVTRQLPPVGSRQHATTSKQAATCPDDALTTSPLQRLRRAMRDNSYTKINASFEAFLIFYSDEHLSEEPSAADRRLEYFSGWNGPGTGAVLADGGAAVWVPAGEVRRARATLSCSWLVMNQDDFSQPSVAEWIAGRLSSSGRVGGDARLASLTEWEQLNFRLQREGLQLIHASTLLDQLWDEEPDQSRRRPEASRIAASLHQSEYTGLSWRNKVAMVRSELRQIGVDAMVVTALDEVAWLLNLRGRDLPYAPLLKAFIVISTKDLRVYAPREKMSTPVRKALAVYDCFSNDINCARLKNYTDIYADLRYASEDKILIPTKVAFQRGASAAIAQSLPRAKRIYNPSPIIYLKAQKNAGEVRGMRVAYLRDAVAMCTLLSNIQETMNRKHYSNSEVNFGLALTETSVAMKVDATRAMQANFVGHSMRTRVAFGPSGADADYRATTHSNRRVCRNSTLIIQSGGQYIEGTTLVTRTLRYGLPSREERRAYTSVLRALAALATLQLPAALPAAHADLAARAPLWAARQDYTHPTGHGVGAALNRIEDPVVIDYRQDNNLHTLKEGYFITTEPAWYEPGKFGVRLGNVLEVSSKNFGYLNFAEATLVPFELHLIDKCILTEYEMNWLNAYNQRIRSTVGPELQRQGLTEVYYWMMNQTEHLLPLPRGGSSEQPLLGKCPETNPNASPAGVPDAHYRLAFVNYNVGFLQYDPKSAK